MSKHKVRTVTVTTGGAQIYEGAGLLVAAVFDHHASASGTIVKLYDGNSTSGIQVFTRSSDTDAGTTVPITLYTDGDLIAGTSTDNVKVGIAFANGLFLNKTGDTTHADVYTFVIVPLIKKSVQVTTTGSAGSGAGGASVFAGAGLLHAVRIKADTLTPTTADIQIKDSPIVNAGNALTVKTNYGYAAEAVRSVVTLTGADEGGTAVLTAATGAYASRGVHFLLGLNVNIAQANAQDAAYQIDFLIEA